MSRVFPHGSRRSSTGGIHRLTSSGGVEGEVSDEVSVDEDVAGGGGDDGEGALAVVAGAEGDAVAAAGVGGTAVDGAVVDRGGGRDWPVGGAALWGGGPYLGGVAAVDGPVRSVVVVDQAEQVELGLSLFEGDCRRLLGEPSLEGLMESFDLAAGLGVIRP